MKDLEKIKTCITHSGRFHADDVISTAFIKTFNPTVKVQRVPEFKRECAEEELVYDIGFGKYDHHQEDRKLNDYNIPYSAFGLLWEDYGREYLTRCNIKNIELAFEEFKKEYVSKIDFGDNFGYKQLKDFKENDLIIRCNPLWFEQDLENKQFDKAVYLAMNLLKCWTRSIRLKVDYMTTSF